MSAPGITVRRATGDDIDAIMAIENAVFDEHAWSAEAMRHDVTDVHCYYVVGEEAVTGRIVGYAGLLCGEGAGEGDIQTVAVSPEVRSRGLGRVMMGELLEEAARRRAYRLFLEVRADNPVAIGLYRSMGFLEVGIRAGYYQPDDMDAVVMRLEPVPGGPDARPPLGPVGSTNPEWCS